MSTPIYDHIYDRNVDEPFGLMSSPRYYPGWFVIYYFGSWIHRLTGPALEYEDGRKQWYIYGTEYNEEEFNQRVQQEILQHPQLMRK